MSQAFRSVVLTVEIEISDDATITNETTRTRSNQHAAGWDNLFGYEAAFGAVLPEAVMAATILDLDTSMSNLGTGEITRNDQINLKLAAVVIPTVIDQNPCAHLRMPRDMIFHGWSMRLFQAWQHSATMSS